MRPRTIGNPTGLPIASEDRPAARNEIVQAVNDKYPPEKTIVWNLTIVDHIIDHPAKYPTLYRIISVHPGKWQRRVISGLLKDQGFTPDCGESGKNVCPFFIRPGMVAS